MADASLPSRLHAYQSSWEWPEGARRVQPNNLHLTLRFLGPTDAPTQARLLDQLHRIPFDPFDLQLEGPGTFPGGIAWLGVSPSPQLKALHERVNDAATAAGFPTPDEPWTPHITLARKSTSATPPSSAPSLDWRVDRFSLVASEGGRYLPIATWPAAAG